MKRNDQAPVEVQDATRYFTDVVKSVNLSDEKQIVITTAGGRLILNPTGFRIEGPSEAMEGLSEAAGQFVNHELQFKLNFDDNSLELIACRGRGRSYHHALGALPPHSETLRATILNANARLSAWHRARSRM